ncbi:MAG TPA: 2Fe-2S iron-sulfur cluster binding domain-containing protein [Alphaproteobacteria bacterium]|jgi:phenol hydroxylase P5 protein|nr:2Fe-2S iron-sulfur cluster binding domain-containing protein [Alphaproteobacteria bacterium]
MYTVTIEPLGEAVTVADGQTILEACLRAGIWLPHACGHGLCGTCKIDVLEGEVDHGAASSFALMDGERLEGKALACSAMPRSSLVIEAEVDEDPDALRLPVGDHIGTVERLTRLTPDVLGIELAVPGDGIAFQAGQYINVTIPGVEGTRPFSIASPPSRPDRIELQVRRVPGGRGTAWLHERLREGDRLAFAGPYGRFFVRKSAPQPLLFLAGGSGLSSPKSMILDLLEQGDARPITLVHGARGREHFYDVELLGALAETHPNFRYVRALSDGGNDPDWDGARGFVHEVAAQLYEGRFAGLRAYLCGPPAMIEACIGVLMKGRLFERDIFTERFSTAADGASSLAKSPLFKRLGR